MEIDQLAGRVVQRVQYWYPGTISDLPTLAAESPVHEAWMGVSLILDQGWIGLSWRMAGEREWLGLNEPWMANNALDHYIVAGATTSWEARGLLIAPLEVGTIRRDNDDEVTGLELRTDNGYAAILTADLNENGALQGTADQIAVVFDDALVADLLKRDAWRRV